MFGDREAAATVAVKDLAAAKRFYEDMLGLKQVHADENEAVSYAAGASRLVVYRSQFAGTNQATAVTWMVGDDLERLVKALKAKGVTFEHYEMPGITLEGDVHVAPGSPLRVAWFKDPDGNIHNLNNG